MTRRVPANPRITLGLAVVGLVLAGCGGAEPDATPEPPAASGGSAVTYVGEVAGTDALIGLAVEDSGAVTAYVCDSAQTSVWLRGERGDGDSLSATGPDGASLTATVAGDAVTGELVLDGADHDFTATLAAPPLGIYVAEHRDERYTLSAAWVLGPDDRLVGSLLAEDPQDGLVVSARFREIPQARTGFPTVGVSVTVAAEQAGDGGDPGGDVGTPVDSPPPPSQPDEELLELRAELLFQNSK